MDEQYQRVSAIGANREEQFRKERRNRWPKWSGLRGTMEPRDPNTMVLAPHPSDYPFHEDHMHALRDYSLYLNTMHLTHANRRTRGQEIGEYLHDKLGLGNLAAIGGMVGSYYGLPTHPRVMKVVVDYWKGDSTLRRQQEQTKEMSLMWDLLPVHMYIDSQTGHLVTMIDGETEIPENLHERLSEYEQARGFPPTDTKYWEWEQRLKAVDKKLDRMRAENLSNITTDMVKSLLFDIFKVSEFTDNLLGGVAAEYLGDLGSLEQHLPTFLLQQTDVKEKTFKLFGEELGMDGDAVESLSKDMPLQDFLKYSAEKLDVDVGTNKLISEKGIDALVDSDIIPDGALPGTVSNPRKLMNMGAPREVIIEANKPSEPVMDQAGRLAAAEIEKLQSKPEKGRLKIELSDKQYEELFKGTDWKKTLMDDIEKEENIIVRPTVDPETSAADMRKRSAAMDKAFQEKLDKFNKAEREQWLKEEREDREMWNKEKEWGMKEGQKRHTREFDRYLDQRKRKHDRQERRKNAPAKGKDKTTIRLENREILLEDPDDDPEDPP